ncbi:transketolase [Methanotrichaceae archaeon M04Ac]|uniref:Transketolase n=1 Tax=Candidatus Methanocrinis alkalitolerans TaxID=3033395 RepID=A0ABT5XEL0_9EURY|nr:transketolase [Candidatus Methanocrinis alkalitolerans]MDF0593117.1 transketolase [Candidatus Methanocrinis alkalitolerans]
MASVDELGLMAEKLRIDSMRSTTAAGSGHPTSCMSAAEIMSTLFFHELGEEDEFILSKGHAAPILWSAYAEAGFVPLEELETLREITSRLEGHPTPRMPLIRVATGSLGQGLAAGAGMALAKRLAGDSGRVYVLMGDGEVAEGSVWETANTAAYYGLGGLCAIIDVNRLGQSGPTMHGHDTEAYARKLEAFGWEAAQVDGHRVEELLAAFRDARKSRGPFAIVARTFKGRGVSFLEDKEGWHGKALNREQLGRALAEIGEVGISLPSKVRYRRPPPFEFVDFIGDDYEMGDRVSTRKAFGNALVKIGKVDERVVVVDADVRNSTMTEAFCKEFPDRCFQAFIAEQNMVGMAIGFSAMGFVPVISTFATFLTRAHDFIRMAQYSRSNIKFVGSHVGVSIGQDGPSQMGLEDLPMFLSMPDSIVLYPSDAVSTEGLMREMMRFEGIAYLRTTRGETPVVYGGEEEFPLGGFKVLKRSDNDDALVISAGITLNEALTAYEILREKGISIRVIDLYSIKPFDSAGLVKNAQECKERAMVVEDHYCYGIASYISEALEHIRKLCISGIPRSGSPQELMEEYGIVASSIVQLAESIIKD